MYTIIPLAGPDFWIPAKNTVKPLLEVNGRPLLETAVSSREWHREIKKNPQKLIFVLRETERTKDFVKYLQEVYPKCQTLILSSLTRGALLSALAGAALIHGPSEPICIDLIDILYESQGLARPEKIFDEHPHCGGIIPCFKNQYEKYSYLVIREGKVVETKEKRVISDNASAGTYFFRNLPIFLKAVSDSLEHVNEYAVNDVLFVCPAYNELIKQGLDVYPHEVKLTQCLSRCVKELV